MRVYMHFGINFREEKQNTAISKINVDLIPPFFGEIFQPTLKLIVDNSVTIVLFCICHETKKSQWFPFNGG